MGCSVVMETECDDNADNDGGEVPLGGWGGGQGRGGSRIRLSATPVCDSIMINVPDLWALVKVRAEESSKMFTLPSLLRAEDQENLPPFSLPFHFLSR